MKNRIFAALVAAGLLSGGTAATIAMTAVPAATGNAAVALHSNHLYEW